MERALKTIASLIIGALAITVVREMVGGNSHRGSATPAMDQDTIVRLTAEKMNKMLPSTIDKYTILENVTAAPGVLFYNYTLTNDDKESASSALGNPLTHKTMINKVCSTSELRRVTLDHGTAASYRYYLTDGTFVGQLKVTNSEWRMASN